MKRFLLNLFALAAASALLSGSAIAATKPNLIFINIDDLGYADIGCFGGQKARTPNVDRMAAEGMKFTSFYAAPVCTASRASLMTGCYARRVSMPGVLTPAKVIGLGKDEMTIAEALKPLGYNTMIIGKWHLGDQPEFLPTRRGFDHYFGLPYSNDMDGSEKAKQGKMPPLPLMRDETVIEAPAKQDELTARYADEAVKFITEHKDKTFFLYLPHTAVHSPHHPGAQFRGKSGHNNYIDWVEEVDWACGRVLDTVRELGLSERTLVCFTSDNGGAGAANNLPLRGHKGTTWEGGVRVPFIAWWPGHVPQGSTGEMASMMDMLPTLVSLAGGTLSKERKIDGLDVSNLLLTAGARSRRDTFYYFQGGAEELQGVRHGEWKYLITPTKKASESKDGPRITFPALFNLKEDIGETTNVINDHPEVMITMKTLVDAMAADLGIDKKPGPGVRPCGKVEKARPLLLQTSN